MSGEPLAISNLQWASQIASRSSQGGGGASKDGVDYRKASGGAPSVKFEVRSRNAGRGPIADL
jgi:hypothetical protein